MRFEVTQQFSVGLDQVFDHYVSETFFEELPDFGRIGKPDLIDLSTGSTSVVVRARYAFTADLPAAALAVIDPERLTWVEETVYDLESRSATVTFLPDHYASKLSATASVRFRGDDTATTRVIAGDLRVKVLLVGGQVERAIVSGLREHLDEEAEFVNRRLTRT